MRSCSKINSTLLPHFNSLIKDLKEFLEILITCIDILKTINGLNHYFCIVGDCCSTVTYILDHVYQHYSIATIFGILEVGISLQTVLKLCVHWYQRLVQAQDRFFNFWFFYFVILHIDLPLFYLNQPNLSTPSLLS